MKNVKVIFIAIVACIIALGLTGCEKKEKLDSLNNTYWECTVDASNYSYIWFYSGNTGKIILCSKGDKTETNVGWKCKSSGYVTISMFPGTQYEKVWLTGSFDSDAPSLKLGSLEYEYKGKAQ